MLVTNQPSFLFTNKPWCHQEHSYSECWEATCTFICTVPEVFTWKAQPFSAFNLKTDQPFSITVQNLFKICSKCKDPFMNQIWHVHVSTSNLNIKKNSKKSKVRFQSLKQYQSSLWNILMAITRAVINISYTCGAMPETSLLHLWSPRCAISMWGACQSCTQQTITRPSPGVNLAPYTSTASKSHAWISQI